MRTCGTSEIDGAANSKKILLLRNSLCCEDMNCFITDIAAKADLIATSTNTDIIL